MKSDEKLKRLRSKLSLVVLVSLCTNFLFLFTDFKLFGHILTHLIAFLSTVAMLIINSFLNDKANMNLTAFCCIAIIISFIFALWKKAKSLTYIKSLILGFFYSTLFKLSIMSIFFNTKWTAKFTINENNNVIIEAYR